MLSLRLIDLHRPSRKVRRFAYVLSHSSDICGKLQQVRCVFKNLSFFVRMRWRRRRLRLLRGGRKEVFHIRFFSHEKRWEERGFSWHGVKIREMHASSPKSEIRRRTHFLPRKIYLKCKKGFSKYGLSLCTRKPS